MRKFLGLMFSLVVLFNVAIAGDVVEESVKEDTPFHIYKDGVKDVYIAYSKTFGKILQIFFDDKDEIVVVPVKNVYFAKVKPFGNGKYIVILKFKPAIGNDVNTIIIGGGKYNFKSKKSASDWIYRLLFEK